MLARCGLLLLFLNCVRTTEHHNALVKDRVTEFNTRFAWWPSVHNAASLVKMKREASHLAQEKPEVLSEGGDKPPLTTPVAVAAGGENKVNKTSLIENKEVISSTAVPGNVTVSNTTVTPVVNNTETKVNSTAEKPKQLDLNNPGVLKRGFIVFGGFALLAVAYFIFYRKKGKNNDTGNAHNSIDANQFRYGVLQSEDRRDNMELSRVPLTMESDDDEDEDLEIFDLEQKKKSLSYVNLQTNDEDVVFSNKEYGENDRENLLLDIEDGNSQTLINWSSNGSKSIL